MECSGTSLDAVKMIRFSCLFVFSICLACSAAIEQVQEKGNTLPPAPEDVAQRELTETGYVIRYGDALYRYPIGVVPLVRQIQPEERNPTETNEIVSQEEDKRRPLFYFTTYEGPDSSVESGLPTDRPYIKIRRKRDLENAEIPESNKVGKLRLKRSYCGRCGKKGGGYGGYGGYYIPVTYTIYPVYYGGGGGKGCNTCGGGGGGGGGSYSYSSSSAQSSAGSYGWGKK